MYYLDSSGEAVTCRSTNSYRGNNGAFAEGGEKKEKFKLETVIIVWRCLSCLWRARKIPRRARDLSRTWRDDRGQRGRDSVECDSVLRFECIAII